MARILLIEPDAILARIYAQALECEGHVVVLQTSAQRAIMQADEQRPDVIILELQLASHSGIEFLYEFRSYADWQQIPIVLFTNVPASEFVDTWDVLRDGLGVSAYLHKSSTTLAQLLRSVREVTTITIQM